MRLSVFVVWLTMLGLTACATAPSSEVSPQAAQSASQDTFSAEGYQLGAGDKVRLTVFGEDELSGEFAVNGTGHVSLPLVGEILVRGMSVREFQRAVDAALRDGFLKDPRVSAEVATYRPFYILGEVKRPGTYAYQSDLTVLNAVATAEGFTYRANERFVFIRREGEEQERKYPLTSTTTVRPGDTIRISERFF